MKKIFEYFKYCLYKIINIFSGIFTINLLFFIYLRTFLLKRTGMIIGNSSFIDNGFKFLHPKNIIIGKYVSLGHHNKIWAFNKVIIGDYVQTALGLTIISGSHNVNDYGSKTDNQEIILEGENWIGANVTILGGVTVGKGTIIGAGSIVVKSLPSYSVCVGNPCRVIRERIPSEFVESPFGAYNPGYFKR